MAKKNSNPKIPDLDEYIKTAQQSGQQESNDRPQGWLTGITRKFNFRQTVKFAKEFNYKKFWWLGIIVLFLVLAGSWYSYGVYKKSVVYQLFPNLSIIEQGCITLKSGGKFLEEFHPADPKILTQKFSSSTAPTIALSPELVLNCIKKDSPVFINDTKQSAE